jgi:LmbE family N-acetylglucosaminyl deacetylase
MDLAEDGHLAYTVEAKVALAREIRTLKPDMLLAPFLQENQHPDHVILARMVRDAARLARYGGYRELKDLPPHKIKSLYYYAGTGVHERHFDVLVDVSAAKDRWVEAINAHASQLGNRDYLHMVLTHAAYFGTLCNCAYAMPLWTNDPVLVDDVAQVVRGGRNF